MLTRILSSGFALVFAMAALQSQAQADVFNSIDVRARHVKSKSNVMMTEFNNHYRGTNHYQKMIDEVRMLRRSADQVSSFANRRRDLSLLVASMTQLDGSFQRLEAEWKRAHEDAARGLGAVRGNTRHVTRLMSELEADIRSLGQWVEQLRQAELERQRLQMYYQAQSTYVPVYQSTYVPAYSSTRTIVYPRGNIQRHHFHGRRPNVNVRPGGMSIGNGRFNVRVRF